MASAVIKEFGGKKFSFSKLSATAGIRFQMTFAKLARDKIEALVNADPDEVLKLMKLAFTRVICDGRPIDDIDLTFGDDTDLLWKVFFSATEVNLSGFLAENRAPGSQSAQETKSP